MDAKKIVSFTFYLTITIFQACRQYLHPSIVKYITVRAIVQKRSVMQ
jgi:hypothetical protein